MGNAQGIFLTRDTTTTHSLSFSSRLQRITSQITDAHPMLSNAHTTPQRMPQSLVVQYKGPLLRFLST